MNETASPAEARSGSDRIALRILAYSGLFTLACLVVQLWVGAFTSDRGQAGDEAAHFVTALMIADYVRAHLFANPLAFALDYYAHFPRVGLGHYPPMFEAVQALLFLVFRHETATAIGFQAVIGGVCAGVPAGLLSRSFGLVVGLLAGIAVLSSPYLLFMVSTVMTDNFFAALIALTALAWTHFYRRRSWGACVLFAALATAAALTRGTGLGLAFFPVIYALLRRDPGFLLEPKTLVAGALIALPVLPWYAATYKMAADGFVYSWGLGYTRLAAPYFAKALVHEAGLPLVAGYLYGLYLCCRPAGPSKPEDKLDIPSFAAMSLSMILFPMLAPADLTSRYIIPAIPCLIIVAVWALFRLATLVLSSNGPPRLRLAVCGAAILISAGLAFQRPHLEPFHAERLAARIVDADRANPLVLVSGNAVVEGAVIAAFAERDAAMKYYVVRGTQVLGSGNFVGTEYHERFASDAEMAAWIKENKIGWIIVDESQFSNVIPTNKQLLAVIKSGALGATPEMSLRHERWLGGTLELYALPDADATPSRSLDVFSALKPSHGF